MPAVIFQVRTIILLLPGCINKEKNYLQAMQRFISVASLAGAVVAALIVGLFREIPSEAEQTLDTTKA